MDSQAEDSGGLRRAIHTVRESRLGDETTFAAGVLTISAPEMAGLLADPALATAGVSLASPGSSTRIVKVLDCVEPRCKGDGPGIFPGLLGPAKVQGRGETHVLRGAGVVAAGYLPRAQEALIDMSGPAAGLSPLGATHNIVVTFTPADGAPWEEVDLAVRRGTLRVASRLAEAARPAEPDAVEELGAAAAGSNGLPRVGAITNLQTQGAFKDVFFYGRSLAGSPPVLIDDREVDDGAVVSGQYGHPALRNPTFVHQNHPVVAALRAADGQRCRFGGLILCPEPVEQGAKELAAAHAARLCAALGWEAAIITKEGGGNADSDISLKMDALEAAGVVAVGLFAEMSGADGTGAPVVSPPVTATAMISTGNYDERLALPAVEQAIGAERFDLLGVDATAAMEVPTAVVIAALSPLGWGKLTAAGAGVIG
ncbi:MAG TPA: glycine/sarcosine/betaine reductase component B subunit [Acidimicrobiales bacterium]|nr:glycine/sarcosine/betaine reductase component B subunit [Acidimicrobiales bacterium]HLI55413.1 glycine/sarcosine/betaine reductase component B subunit [Actinomycetota bacterium]